MDPVMEPIFTKMIPCPGVRILKMIPCSAARPRTEKYMSTPPPPPGKSSWRLHLTLTLSNFYRTCPVSHGEQKHNCLIAMSMRSNLGQEVVHIVAFPSRSHFLNHVQPYCAVQCAMCAGEIRPYEYSRNQTL